MGGPTTWDLLLRPIQVSSGGSPSRRRVFSPGLASRRGDASDHRLIPPPGAMQESLKLEGCLPHLRRFPSRRPR
uniref:Uncharacterized protein n=1 Tax=Arundo donax TaxID=35708 RepID=A0A0A9BTL1_ARUDO